MHQNGAQGDVLIEEKRTLEELEKIQSCCDETAVDEITGAICSKIATVEQEIQHEIDKHCARGNELRTKTEQLATEWKENMKKAFPFGETVVDGTTFAPGSRTLIDTVFRF